MGQLELFPRIETAVSTTPSVDAVRARIQAALGALRGAATMPWTAREAARWRLVLPQMADWLPEDEGDAVRREFGRLMDGFERPLAAE